MNALLCVRARALGFLREQERYATVRACNLVHEVVEDAPLITDAAFLALHNIHFVAIGEEYYDDPNDKYYTVSI